MPQDPPPPPNGKLNPPPPKKNQFWIRAWSENDFEITSGSVSEIYKMDLDAVSTFVQQTFSSHIYHLRDVHSLFHIF